MSSQAKTASDFYLPCRAFVVCVSMACALSHVGAASPAGHAKGITTNEKGGPQTVLTVTNSLDIPRPEEVIAIPLAAVQAKTGIDDPQQIRVQDAVTQKELPTQLETTVEGRPPDKLLVLVSVAAQGTLRLAFDKGKKATAEPLVYGRAVPERKDDFAWENGKVAYRVYGPALEAGGEVSSGIDVWSKRTPHLIVNDWYKRDAEGQRTKNPALSYHRDNGDGLDSYDVGPTRGCGATGIWADGKLYVSNNYTAVDVLESGPLRIRFRLRYAPWRAADLTVTEEKVVTLEAGSHLNQIESTFTFDRPKSAQIALGLGLHPGTAAVAVPGDGGVLAVWEPLTDPAAGMDGTAIVLPAGKASTQVDAPQNRLLLVTAESGIPVTYYAGAGWSRSDIPSADAWSIYLRGYKLKLRHPLELRWSRQPMTSEGKTP